MQNPLLILFISQHINLPETRLLNSFEQLSSKKVSSVLNIDPSKPKEFWKVCNSFIESRSSIPTLSSGSTYAESDIEKAELLNAFFASCFSKSHPPLTKDSFSVDHHNDFPDDLLCSEDSILHMLSSLDTSKSSGPDAISATMLRTLQVASPRGSCCCLTNH